MRVPDFFDRCIICMERPVGDPEHLIPECIGGTLTARVLCNPCNHTLGTQLIGRLTSDPAIKRALDALKNEIPILFKRALPRPTLVGRAEDGSIITARESHKGAQILSSQGSGGSIVKGSDEAKEDLKKVLARSGATQEEISRWQKKYDELQNDTPLVIPTGHRFVKRTTPPLQFDLRGKFISNRLPGLIAFEFWSLVIGERIYEKAFDPIRRYISDGAVPNQLRVENFRGPKYDCFHKIAIEPTGGAIGTSIQFFRWIGFHVKFLGYDHHGPDSLYFEDLKMRRGFCALTMSDAKEGNWITT